MVYGMALEEGPLELQSGSAVIEDGAVRQHQTDSPALRDMVRRFPNERRRDLLVGNRVLMIGLAHHFAAGVPSTAVLPHGGLPTTRSTSTGYLHPLRRNPRTKYCLRSSALGGFRVVDQPR